MASCAVIRQESHSQDVCPDGPADKCVTATDPSLMSVAHDLDHLERHIDWYGSIVPKTPDVWGQARLTKHRQEYEAEMSKELGIFSLKSAGRIARMDQLFFANSLALNAAISGRNATQSLSTGTSTTNLNLNASRGSDSSSEESLAATRNLTRAIDYASGRDQSLQVENGKLIETLKGTESASNSLKGSDSTELKNNSKNSSKQSEGSSGSSSIESKQATTLLAVPTTADIGKITPDNVKFGDFGSASDKSALEPSEYLVQKNRYLNFLNQLRRNGEGDDTADSPGYSLNLMRIPVSVLPGKRTDTGHGAEVTMTLNAELGDEFLPWTFRKLVMNDLMEHLGFTLTKILDDDEFQAILNNDTRCSLMGKKADILLGECKAEKCATSEKNLSSDGDNRDVFTTKLSVTQTKNWSPPNSRKRSREGIPAKSPEQMFLSFHTPALPAAKGVLFRSPVPSTQLIEVYGIKYAFEIACSAQEGMGYDVALHGYAHFPDVQSFIQEQATAAYRLLMEPGNTDLWNYCSPELVKCVRNRDVLGIYRIRNAFRCDLANRSGSHEVSKNGADRMENGKTAAFAWAIIVDSALLTERLIQDIRETASTKGTVLDAEWKNYANPNPTADARQTFNSYVQLRWPIRVFALDPDVEEQNISDRMTTRREMQQAMALAFVTGRISANSFTRFARRLDAEYETVSLNRTQIGFSHGENTFGWRFYPRFQTPDTPSNIGGLLRDTLVGGPSKDHLLQARQLEPGPRECVALVMMPSFVPYLTMDTTSNWFSLTNPKHKVMDHTEGLKLSKVVKTLQTQSGNAMDAQAYRDSDQRVLRSRVEQLASRLPMQTTKVQVPMANTVGGHGMFNNGITDLAPELYGFYGAPGVDKAGGTTLFLVGDHFSVNRTEALVGNRRAQVTLLSRQVAKIELSAGMFETNEGYLRVHVATPYGVSREIDIPVVSPNPEKKEPAKAAEGFSLKQTSLTIEYLFVPAGDEKNLFKPVFCKADPEELKVVAEDANGNLPKRIQFQAEFSTGENSKPITIPLGPIYLDASFPLGAYKMDKLQLSQFCADLVTKLTERNGLIPKDGGELSKKLTLKQILITPVNEKNEPIGKTVPANNTLEITFVGNWNNTVKPEPRK